MTGSTFSVSLPSESVLSSSDSQQYQLYLKSHNVRLNAIEGIWDFREHREQKETFERICDRIDAVIRLARSAEVDLSVRL